MNDPRTNLGTPPPLLGADGRPISQEAAPPPEPELQTIAICDLGLPLPPENSQLAMMVLEMAGRAQENLTPEERYPYQLLGMCVRPHPTERVAVGMSPSGEPIMEPMMIIGVGTETILTWVEVTRALAARDARIDELEKRLAAVEGRSKS